MERINVDEPCWSCDWSGNTSEMDYNHEAKCLYCPNCSATLIEGYYEDEEV